MVLVHVLFHFGKWVKEKTIAHECIARKQKQLRLLRIFCKDIEIDEYVMQASAQCSVCIKVF